MRPNAIDWKRGLDLFTPETDRHGYGYHCFEHSSGLDPQSGVWTVSTSRQLPRELVRTGLDWMPTPTDWIERAVPSSVSFVGTVIRG